MKWLGLTIAAIAAVSRPALADSREADTLVAEADALAKSGDLVGAAAKFKAAYAADPRPALICNVGVAYYKAKDVPRAHLFLSRCLERGTALDGKFVDNVRAVLKAVETSLRDGAYTPVDIVVEPGGAAITLAAFGDDEGFIGSRVVWLPSGKQVVRAKAEGYQDQLVEIEATGHDPQVVRVTLERKPTETIVTPPPPPPPRPAPVVAKPSLVPPIVATGATLLATTMVVIAYGRAHDAADLAEFALTSEAYQQDVDTTNRWNTIMGASAALAVIGAGASGYLWFRATHTASPVEVEPTAGGVAFRISARW